MSYNIEMLLQVKQLEVALKESKERGIEDRQRMQKEIEQMKSWTRLRKQPAQKTSAHIGQFFVGRFFRFSFQTKSSFALKCR